MAYHNYSYDYFDLATHVLESNSHSFTRIQVDFPSSPYSFLSKKSLTFADLLHLFHYYWLADAFTTNPISGDLMTSALSKRIISIVCAVDFSLLMIMLKDEAVSP